MNKTLEERFYKVQADKKSLNIGQLVTIKDDGYGGYGLAVKVHYFNKKGVFVGNYYEFFEWEKVFLHKNKKMFSQIHYSYNHFGGVFQFLYELKCKIATYFMKLSYID